MASENDTFLIPLPDRGQQRIVVIGGGFGGIRFIRALPRNQVQVVLIDRHNYHTFTPLMYQIATAGLDPTSVARPLRLIFKRRRDFHFRMASVEQIVPEKNKVVTDIGEIGYDYLVIATGAANNFFGMKDVQEKAFTVKDVPEALYLKTTILRNFEKALLASCEQEMQSLMDYVVVGGGPTGVEVAGALAELKKNVLPNDYPELKLKEMDIYLVEATGKLLGTMSGQASEKAEAFLKELGVKVLLNKAVRSYDGYRVKFTDGTEIISRTLVWGAGVAPATIPGLHVTALAKGNRILVDGFNRVVGEDNVFAVGDVAAMVSEARPRGYPMLAPVAMQQGTQLGKNIRRLLKGQRLKPFSYFDKGAMATVGRNRAVADLPFWRFSGWFAWVGWMAVHLFYLIGFRNRLVVLIDWMWNYLGYEKAPRLIITPVVKKQSVQAVPEEKVL